MSKIVCKFKCETVVLNLNSEQVKMGAVRGDANKPWSLYTPLGDFSATITNPDAMGQFKPGRDYYIEIRDADPDFQVSKVPATVVSGEVK